MKTKKFPSDLEALLDDRVLMPKLYSFEETRKLMKEMRNVIRVELMSLIDWIEVVDRAVKMRPTSWGENPIREWRNASDEIWYALASQAEAKGIFPTLEERLKGQKKKLNNKRHGQ